MGIRHVCHSNLESSATHINSVGVNQELHTLDVTRAVSHFGHRCTVVNELRTVCSITREGYQHTIGLRPSWSTRESPASHTPETNPLVAVLRIVGRVVVGSGVLHNYMVSNHSVEPKERNAAFILICHTCGMEVGTLNRRAGTNPVFHKERVSVDTLNNSGRCLEFYFCASAAGIGRDVGEGKHIDGGGNNGLGRGTDLDIVHIPAIRGRCRCPLANAETYLQFLIGRSCWIDELLQIETFFFPHGIADRGGTPVEIGTLMEASI